MSSDGGLGGLLGGLFGGKGGIGKVLQDLLGGAAPGSTGAGKIQIPTPDNAGGPIQPPQGQAGQPGPSRGQGMPQGGAGQPGQGMPRPGQPGIPQGQPGQGMPQGQPGMPAGQGRPGQPGQGRPGMPAGQGQPGQGTPQGQPGMPAGQGMPKPQPPIGGAAATAGASTIGLDSLLERLRKAGLGDQVNSWLSDGPNKTIDPRQVSQALGARQIHDMAQHAGVSETELSQGLAQAIPAVVDDVTPHGEMPTQDQLQQWMRKLTG